MGISFKLVVITGDYDESQSKQKEIDSLFKELETIMKSKRKRPIIKGNWFEIRGTSNYRYTFNKLRNGELNVDGGEFNAILIDWFQKVQDLNLTISISGGDNQVVIKLV
jgi:hypothetical protein